MTAPSTSWWTRRKCSSLSIFPLGPTTISLIPGSRSWSCSPFYRERDLSDQSGSDRSLEHFASLLGVAGKPGEPTEMLFRRVREKLDARERAVTEDEIGQQILAQPAELWPKNEKSPAPK